MMTPFFKKCAFAGVLMIAAAVSASILTPTIKIGQQLGAMDLETMVPKQFGDWTLDQRPALMVISPEQRETLSRLYTQTLSRTYINKRSGDAVMLSIAYGDDQRDSVQLHYPEVCYPAQGFEILSKQPGTMNGLPQTSLPVIRLLATKGSQRIEPITYWVMIGEKPTVGRWQKKQAEMSYGFKGFIADGLLFRVSSINADVGTAYQTQEYFISQLFGAMSPKNRSRFFGQSSDVHAVH